MNPSKPFLPQVFPLMVVKAYDYASTPNNIPSTTLRRSMFSEFNGATKAQLIVPYYWATFYHNGRGAVKARPGGFLAYYKNPKQDPRYKGGYPLRPQNVRSLRDVLTNAQFKEDINKGKIVLRKNVGPVSPSKIHPFFSDNGGMAGLGKELNKLVGIESDIYVEQKLKAAGIFKQKVKIVL